MTHTFDTKAPKPARTILQQGVVSLLSALKRPTGYLGDVVSFGGLVRSYTDVELGISHLVDTLKRTPAIGVATGSRTYEVTGLGGKEAKGDIELLLYFATNHGRNRHVGRHESDHVALANDTADPGLHVIMEHAMELMIGQRAGATQTVKQIKPMSEEELVTNEAVTIWLQTYRVTTLTYGPGSEWRTPAQLLTSIGWRATTEREEDNRPDAATSPTSLDFDTPLT